MSKQLLIYEKAMPVSKQRHGNWSVKAGSDFAFAKEVNSVPLTAVEFPAAATEYPIVFAGSDEVVMPAVILGVRRHENVYLAQDGTWKAKYIPAFVRRYPFVFSSTEGGKSFTLCIDEDFAGCNQEGRGERLFDADGEKTKYLDGVLDFIKQYQAQFQRTQVFCKMLKELDLLEPMQAQLNLGTGQKVSLTGFMAVNRDRLKKLSSEKLAELAKTDQLELIYLHLHAMRNFRAMAERALPQNEAQENATEKSAEGSKKLEEAAATV